VGLTPFNVTSSDADGIRAFRQSLKRSSALVRGAVLHSGEARPLDKDLYALPWSWLVPRTARSTASG